MSELFLAYRDGVGINSTVVLENKPVIIKDLPPGCYDLSHQGKLIAEDAGLGNIPGFLLYYCTGLEKEGFQFEGNDVYDCISNLEIKVNKR